jgi:two-component system OmpR family sensor kinase
VAVEDTGPGIPEDVRERVFEPFFRILGSQQSGSGLGLAIVRSAASALGGEVELAERLDGAPGLRFVYRQKLA